jgi:hypothetical protein
MNTPALTTASQGGGTSPALKTILTAGFLAGLLDCTAAMAHSYFWNDVTPDRVWKYVASGAVGMSAFSGGGGTVALGLFFHFLIAFIFTVVFFYLYPAISKLRLPVVITGMLWGLVVWNVMHWIVVPMSSVPPRKAPFDLVKALPQLGIHMFLVGLPMALIIHRYYARRSNSTIVHSNT